MSDPLRVTTNIGSFDACDHEHVLAAIAKHVGFDPVPLRKALIREPREPDPRFLELDTLIRAAHRDWERWGDWLLRKLEEVLKQGRGLPLRVSDEALLRETLRRYRVGVTGTFSGDWTEDGRSVGMAQPEGAKPPTVELAYRMGRRLDPGKPPPPSTTPPAMGEVVREALGLELTPQDRVALDYVKRRGAIYMRRPATLSSSEVDRVLTEAEYAQARGAIAKGVTNRWSATRTARELRDTVKGPTLLNDMMRVARTELAFAHAHGAYEALKVRAADAGVPDPQVYKLVRPGACHDCTRIWGPVGAPIRYRLSQIEGREALGGNFRKPRAEWGPTIGPVHPNCTEGPLLYYHPSIERAVDAAMADYYQFFGRT